MHINLILGVLVLGALIWLIVSHRRKPDPADMLQDEIARRRASQSAVEKAARRFEALRNTRLDEVAAGLESMRQALAENGLRAELLDWSRNETCLELHLAGEKLKISWDVPNLDLSLFAASESASLPLGVRAEYSLTWPDRSRRVEEDLSAFMRQLSGLIADKLA